MNFDSITALRERADWYGWTEPRWPPVNRRTVTELEEDGEWRAQAALVVNKFRKLCLLFLLFAFRFRVFGATPPFCGFLAQFLVRQLPID